VAGQQGAQIRVEFTDLAPIREALKQFPLQIQSKIVGQAVRKAIKPALSRLRAIVPVGPTGNLKAAVTSAVREYPKNGTAVGLVGYRAAGRAPSGSAAGGSVQSGKDRAFHQGFIEFGTKERKVPKSGQAANKKYQRQPYQRVGKSGTRHTVSGHVVSRQGGFIASSFNRLGPFKIDKTGQPKNNRVTSSPRYPGAFFRKFSTTKPIPGTPVGGRAGTPPVKTAFESTQGEMGSILAAELGLRIEEALKAVTSLGKPTGL
jgi:hypothetical protein